MNAPQQNVFFEDELRIIVNATDPDAEFDLEATKELVRKFLKEGGDPPVLFLTGCQVQVFGIRPRDQEDRKKFEGGDVYKIRSHHTFGSDLVTNVREWVYPEGTSAREIVLKRPNGTQKMIWILCIVGIAPRTKVREGADYPLGTPHKSLPIPFHISEVREDDLIEARRVVRESFEKYYGLTGEPRVGELHDGPEIKQMYLHG